MLHEAKQERSVIISVELKTSVEKFICINGDKRHKGTIKTCTGCNVTMDIKIKLITRHTCKKDKDVRTHPCMIIIEGVHNHHTQAALQQLRVLRETKDDYFKYFNLGMSVSQAVRSHQEKMNLSRTDLTNCALNPTHRAVYHIRQLWMNENHGTLDGENEVSYTAGFQLLKKVLESNFDYDWKLFCQTPEAKKYDLYIRYLTTLIQRKAEWSTMYRPEFPLCGHQTNNFAESTVCIIKDIILNRCKASNTCQLIVFMNEMYDIYMKQCVLDVSLGRRKVMSPTEGSISKDNIIMSNDDDYQFIVKSQSGDKQYTVHLITGMCDCSPALCKEPWIRPLKLYTRCTLRYCNQRTGDVSDRG
ncbi:hypothetical protein Pcinc_013825 [Petrolisthes cinctipes]|uniref:SWIM-type domain-containing protein n=1 Tax=Petrolisthes cinctipes TaxID=88211 RepID=A0AAE1FW55_PETCI|nr:hypothetical protein Pcinc_013825 [Petrolisthes cinctipes]